VGNIGIAYDFHIHTALSPCADDDMTPNNIVNMSFLNSLGAIAITDHNSTLNCRAVSEAGAARGIIVVPGMELTSAEEIHVLCLFPDVAAAERFGALVRARLPEIKNRKDIFGRQLVIDSRDEITGEEDILLSNAASIPLWEIADTLKPYGGIPILAHIDRSSNGVLAVLGDIDADMGFSLAEVSKNADRAYYEKRFPFLHFLTDSDAHRLWEISEKEKTNEIDGDLKSAQDILVFLKQIGEKSQKNF
jgi:PHP family Zn ribbon phosphoesterase